MGNVSLLLLLVFPISGLALTIGPSTATASLTGSPTTATTPSSPTTTAATTTTIAATATRPTPETWNMTLVWHLDKPGKPSGKDCHKFKKPTSLRWTLLPTGRYIFRNKPLEDGRVVLISDSTGRYWLYGAVLPEERS